MKYLPTIIIFLIALALAGLLFDHLRPQHVFPGIRINGENLGRMSFDDVDDFLETFEGRMYENIFTFSLEGSASTTTLDELGVSLDRNKLYERITTHGHEALFFPKVGLWLRSLTGSRELDLARDIVFDTQVLTSLLETQDIDTSNIVAPFDGEIRVNGSEIYRAYPQEGFGIDYAVLRDEIADRLTNLEEERTLEINLTVIEPQVTQIEFETALEDIEQFFSRSFIVRDRTGEIILRMSPEELMRWVDIVQEDTTWRMKLSLLGQQVLIETLGPRDASFAINDDYTIAVVPSRRGYVFEEKSFLEEIQGAFDAGRHEIEVRSLGYTDPNFTTEDAEDLEIKHVLAQFTTYHPCCADRVTNIQLMADLVDGTIIQPVETFDLNEHIGERTPEKGFVPAGMLMFGEMIDSVGGGVSQFATTLYNAVYWGGLGISAHKPHSQYFPRYPEGIEATISWRYPTLRFVNTYNTPIVILASYTEDSITLTIAGDNDGRILVGEQANNKTIMNVVERGGDRSRIVSSDVSLRYDFFPAPIRYLAYPRRYSSGTRRVVEQGRTGWVVDVTRRVTFNPAGITDEEVWNVRYEHPQIIHVANCDEVNHLVFESTNASCITAQ